MALANLSVKISADIGGFTSGMDQASKVAKDRMGQSAGAADAFRSSLLQTSAAMQQMAAAMSANMGAANDAITKGSIESAAAIAGIGEAASKTNLDGLKDKATSAFDGVVEQSKSMGEKIKEHLQTGVESGMEVAKRAIEGALAVRAVYAFSTSLGVLAGSLLRVYAIYSAIKAVGSFAVGLVTGDSYKSENIDALIKSNEEVKSLQKNFQMSSIEAGAFNETFKRLGVSANDYKAVYDGITSSVRTNGDELDRLGVKYKDASGKLLENRQVMENAKAVLDTYTDGWDRNQAAVAIGMGTYDQITSALKVTDEQVQVSKARMDEYQLGISAGAQQMISDYEQAMRDFGRETDLMGQGFKRVMADALMPAFTSISSWFKDGWPSLVQAFRVGVSTIVGLAYAMADGFYIVAQGIVASFGIVKDVVSGVASALMKAATGDMKGAWNALVGGYEGAKDRFKIAGEKIVAQVMENDKKIKMAIGDDGRSASIAASKPATSNLKKWVAKPDAVKESPATAARQNPFEGAMNSLGAQKAGMDFVIANFDKFQGKVKESKAAMAEFDITMGKFSDAQRDQQDFKPLTEDQKKGYIELNKQLDAAAQKERELQAVRKFGTDIQQYIFQQKQIIEARQQDVDWMDKSQQEIAKLSAARQIDAQIAAMIRAKEIELGSGNVDAIKAQTEALKAQGEELKAASSKVIDQGYDKAEDPWFNLQQSIRQYGEEAQNVGQQIGQAMTNAFKGAEDALVTFATTGKLSFKGLAQSILADLARIQAKNLIASLTGAGSNAVGSLGGGLGGLLQQWATMAGAGGSSSPTNGMGIMGDVIAGARAEGGPVSGGSNYLVGEKGAEVFTPSTSGTIIPNHALGGKGLTVNIINNAGAQVQTKPSADGSSIDILINAIKNSIGEDIAYGTGPVNGALQSRYGLRATV